MKQKKIYRTVIQYEILSDEPINDRSLDLETIKEECENGAWSGKGLETIVADEELTGKKAVEAVMDHGTDPEFFQMDTDGNEFDSDREFDDHDSSLLYGTDNN